MGAGECPVEEKEAGALGMKGAVDVRTAEGELTGLHDRFDTRGGKGRGKATLKFPDWGLEVC